MTRLIVGKEAIWTKYGMTVPVRIVSFSGPRNRDAQIVVLTDTFDDVSGFTAGDRYSPVPRSQLSR